MRGKGEDEGMREGDGERMRRAGCYSEEGGRRREGEVRG